LKLVISDLPVFIIFDSHPRPAYPNGAGFVFNTSLDATARQLERLLAVDSKLLADRTMQWQAQLLSHYSGHIFVSKSVNKNYADMVYAVLHSSLATLALQAEITELKFQNSSLTSENQRLYAENDKLEGKCRTQEANLLQNASWHIFGSNPKKNKSKPNRHPNAVAGPSRRGHGPMNYSTAPDRHPDTTEPQDRRRSADNRDRSAKSADPLSQTPLRGDGDTYRLEQQFNVQDARFRAEQKSLSEAYKLQQQLNEEEARLQAEQKVLAAQRQRTFSCGICMDDHPDDSVARIDGCEHQFCRECIRGYIGSKLDDHRFPILCPLCTAEGKDREPSCE
jgi:FtsZ-binding cell division protein ZapB